MDTINRNLQIENYNRKNTIKIQFAQSATRPSAQEIHQWIVKKMVINTDQVDTLQLHNRERAIYLKEKVKKVKPPTLDEQLHPVKHILEATPSEFILNYTQLKSLYENTVGVTDILKVALSYTNDTEGLIEMLQKLYPHYQDKGIKNELRGSKTVCVP
ncbi:hypothetical protein ANN_12158 [Periplaneta americana]|uniref:Uncharacterized protein n=1 Tax=Periplaneta americana TaxID=6978 RepID=A0ABQ8T9E2_PERAM|nr:hypothetical protein ANN_12158 [Periplaneta americana]